MESPIPRTVLQRWLSHAPHPQRAFLLLGARRTGKTQLLNQYLKQCPFNTWLLNGEDEDTLQLLETRTAANYRRLLAGKELLAIDEAQYIPDIGRKAKLMLDEVQGIRLILSGSSALDLAGQSGEPLTGRKTDFHLHPLAYEEWQQVLDPLQLRQQLEDRLLFGNYPELHHLNTPKEKAEYLKNLVSTYLLKDILILDKLRSPQLLFKLLKLLALQTGNQVSFHELGQQLGASKNTIARYMELLQKTFVIFPLSGFSRNLRKEITKSKVWYFWDNGIRNALLNQFQPLALRQDTGQLWENYFVSERIKYCHYHQPLAQHYFWRTYDQQEVDLLEEENSQLQAFELKWNPKAKARPPKAFAEAYPEAQFNTIHPENYEAFLGQ